MSTDIITQVGLKQEEEMIFKCDLGNLKLNDLFIDEKHKKNIDKIGPSPVKLLGISILGCLAASFSFCLQKRNFSLLDLEGKAELTIARNNKGFWRVKKVNIDLIPRVDNPKAHKRINQCIKFFEQYCIISESVKTGFDVSVNVKS